LTTRDPLLKRKGDIIDAHAHATDAEPHGLRCDGRFAFAERCVRPQEGYADGA
jgi:hypothetical protein